MFRAAFLIAGLLVASAPAQAQTTRDAAATLGRDLGTPTTETDRRIQNAPNVVAGPSAEIAAPPASGIFVGAINIDGDREIPRAMFAPVIERFIGKTADATGLQAIARAIADIARGQGYVFASAIIPQQEVASGTVTVKLDMGAVDSIRITGSNSARLRRTLDLIIGPAVRKETLERQLLLAGDIPGIQVYSTRYVREPGGAALIVEVTRDRVSGSAGLDNYGSRELGPARLRLRLDLTGLMDAGDQLTAQVVSTPLQPKELGYASLRYAATVDNHGTQIGIAGAIGRTEPEYNNGANVVGKSSYAAIFASHPIVRSNRASLWVNAELAYLHVDQRDDGVMLQRDNIATFTLAATGTGKVAGGRLWGGFGVVQGLGIGGTTRTGDPMASRLDGSGRFTKATLWLDFTRSIDEQVSVRLAANGQLASRPLLAAQELGIGGPGFGRAYDFSERFGDNGILGLIEIRERFEKPVRGFDWVQLYQFLDGGYVSNLQGGFGDGTRLSAGGGLRAGIGKTSIGIEAAVPLDAVRYGSNNKSPRINLTVGQDF